MNHGTIRPATQREHALHDLQSTTTTPADLAALMRRLREKQRQLRLRPLREILECLEMVVARWLEPQSPWRRAAEEMLPAATGFSPEMIRYALPFMIEPLAAAAPGQLLDRELGDRCVLDSSRDGRTAIGVPVILHVLSGNLPATAAVPVATSLAIKSAVVVKAAAGDRVFPGLLRRSIVEVDSQLGEVVAACYWPGGDRACEAVAFRAADLVVASGSDTSIADAHSRCPARFIGHAHKVSFALVTREVLADTDAADEAARGLALDASIWDQRGCLSPQVCFVEGDFAAACRFAERLVAPLDELAAALPPGRKTIEEQTEVHRFRDEAEWGRFGGTPTLVFASRGSTDWTVVVQTQAELRPTPLCRSLRVCPIESPAALPHVLAPAHRLLEAAGLATTGGRKEEISTILAGAGVSWICRLGRMQRPSLAWPQCGHPRIAHWVTWAGADDGFVA